jgi:TetR/AcrR family transcriptional repressor of nem operon
MARTKEFDRDVALERAMDVFWEKGYEAASLTDLVTAMGIGRQSLYDTFGDKHSLYLAALDRYGALVGARMLAPLDEPGPLKPALRRVFDWLIAEALCHGDRGCFAVNATVERASCDADVAGRAVANVAGGEEKLRRALEWAQTTGEIGARHDPRALARYLFNAMQGLRVTAKATADREALEDIARVTLSVLGSASLFSPLSGTIIPLSGAKQEVTDDELGETQRRVLDRRRHRRC